MNKQISTILKSVTKPGRYSGGEYGQIIKDKANVKARFAFAFPDTYEIGMSNLGVRILYEALNRESDIWCERVYDPWVDMQEMMKKNEPVDISKLRKQLFNNSREKNISNVDYISNALKLRDALLEKGERDPFVPYGDKVTLTAEHFDKANMVAEVLKECVEFADGDSGIFTAELQRRTKDTMPRFKNR